MEEAETTRKVKSFFIMDENFLLQRKRAMELLGLHEAGRARAGRSTSSPRPTPSASTPCEELVELGISWIWMGLESPHSSYSKLDGADTVQLTRELREHGIKLLGSTIVGLEHHTPENIAGEIEHAVAHETDFHQFMLYTPVPGTPLYARDGRTGPAAGRRSGRHSRPVQASTSSTPPSRARNPRSSWTGPSWRDFERNGPSLYRICRTTFEGWKRYKNHPDLRVRERFEREARSLRHAYAGMLWAMEHRLERDQRLGGRADPRAAPGPGAGIRARRRRRRPACSARSCGGPAAARRSAWPQGHGYEPPTIIERRNWLET